jgi:hypothetical protein
MTLNYEKRKNLELFKSLESHKTLFLSKTQNYCPIYNRFFLLNESNYNSINLNHKWYISSIKENEDENNTLFDCKIKNITTLKTKNKQLFFKLAPLVDPFKYMIGKYEGVSYDLFTLPSIESNKTNTTPKFLDYNNSAYVDGFFVYLTSYLNEKYDFTHGIDFFGSFLSIKKNYKINIFDDLEYLNNSDFFNKNKNILFKVDNYDHLFQTENKKKPIQIEHNTSVKSCLSILSFDDHAFEEIFDDTSHADICDLVDLTNSNMLDHNFVDKTTTIKTSSTCSSRTSHTTTENSSKDEPRECQEDEEEDDEEGEEDYDEGDEWEDISSSTDFDEEEVIEATIAQFPVHVISMEHCENTFDDLILNNVLTTAEWHSAFMQIIMILITYQKTFSLTHNDLHTNNVMYNNTTKKYVYYYYKKTYYKVPTFGKIFKIIDFGRSIYKYNGQIFCSDSFQTGNDAATQYNTEPYFNDKKARLDPNFSFDLCRLACSIFDYVIINLDDIKTVEKLTPVQRLIHEWCLDDKGINLLYKNNGVDRYPDFKLYKMIARCVHNHTPNAQLERPEFKSFIVHFNETEIPADLINIDKIPVYI